MYIKHSRERGHPPSPILPSGAVCAPGSVPLPGLALVPAGQEGPGGRLLVGPGHRAAVQPLGQHGAGVLPVVHRAAQPAEGAAAGEVDQRGRGEIGGGGSELRTCKSIFL